MRIYKKPHKQKRKGYSFKRSLEKALEKKTKEIAIPADPITKCF